MKLGAVIVPRRRCSRATTCATASSAARVRHVIAAAAPHAKFDDVDGRYTRIAVGGEPRLARLRGRYGAGATFAPDGATQADDPLLLYFTSGTTSKPKLVLHTHQSYPVGHLSTMYWIGLQPGDVHWNISSPGWAKHAWSCFFAPWNAGATVFIYNSAALRRARHCSTCSCATTSPRSARRRRSGAC